TTTDKLELRKFCEWCRSHQVHREGKMPNPKKTEGGTTMAKSDLAGTRKLRGNKISHSNIKTGRWQNPNLQERRIFVPELKRYVRLKLSTREIRTLDKIGVAAFMKKLGRSLDSL